ncbi:ABC transporter ATP-binding protein [Candidatus Dojkabacteria bacterium]|uniref:ABC transporter ATP-binding protein n=1 Tax=Candidatus Dojkabacteria bacterium TaxID=2099670 RepID=A0A955ICA4_9BACT|nr:ABC transporter ATP-binding protein [Candidatus Dojkabacteria bacterium]
MKKQPKEENLLSFLKDYKVLIFLVITLSLLVNGLSLLLPKLNERIIDSLQNGTYDKNEALTLFGILTAGILVFSIIQNILGSITSEKIAADLRTQVINKISKQSFTYINKVTTSKLLTNLIADVDAVKMFINQGIIIAFAAVVQLIGSIILLLSINWQLAIPIILTIPVLLVSFGVIFSRIEKYFTLSQEIIDKLNSVINENVTGSALIRVLSSQRYEGDKFEVANTEAKDIGTKIVRGFASLFPIISLVINFSFFEILGFGGSKVIDGSLTAGEFAAFFSYIFIFVTPVIMIGFLASSVGRAFAAYKRIKQVIDSELPKDEGTISTEIKGDICMKNVTLDIDNKRILDNIHFDIKAGSRVGIMGPTAAGKTQIFYLITGLIDANKGEILIDGKPISDYEKDSLYSQMGMVFQDSIIYNTTIRENIAFINENVSEESINRAIKTAELEDFIATLPEGLDTKISERGVSLSGGQKQRLTLARALAIDPKIILLDDFTARVDINTERRIIKNLRENYPGITIVAITQKINSIEDFDNIILVMEGELVAQGKHEDLLKNSLEYQLIYKSQQRTED